MEQIIGDYFGEILSTSNPSTTLIDEILESMHPRVTTEMNHQLSTTFTPDEVHYALSHMAPLKSPPALTVFPSFSFKNIGILSALILLLPF